VKQQTKDLLGLMVIVIPMCALTLAVWFHSPMYEGVLIAQRLNAAGILRQAYYFGDHGPVDIDKEGMIEHYGFTDEDINPGELLKSFIEAQE